MPIDTDIEVRANRDVRWTGAAHGAAGAGYYSVLELHRFLHSRYWLLNSTGDDLLDITRPNPSQRSTDQIITLLNSFNIDDTVAEHLYGGTVIQASGATIYDGFIVLSKPGTDLQIVQNGAIVTNAFWNSVPSGSALKGLNSQPANGVSHQFLLKVRNGGTDIDGRRLIGQTREFGFTFSEFRINGTSRGVNVLALDYKPDLNNATAEATTATWSDITNVVSGYALTDVNNDGTNEPYYSRWDLGSRSINQFYERAKWLTRRGSASTMYGLNGELFRGITHEVNTGSPTGTFNAFERVTWGGGAGQMLAINSPTAGTKLWLQLLTGVAPANGQVVTGTTSAATCTVNGTPVDRELSFPFAGISTGTSIIGSYGLGFEALDLSARDKVFDLTNAQRTPPNYVTFSVAGLVVGDAVEVTPRNGTNDGPNETQMALSATLNGAAVTAVPVSTSIPADTPATGFIRVNLSLSKWLQVPYTSWSGSTFTIPSTNFSASPAPSGNGVYVAYVSKIAAAATEAFTTIFSANRPLWVNVTNGNPTTPIEPFQTPAELTSAGGSVTVQRRAD